MLAEAAAWRDRSSRIGRQVLSCAGACAGRGGTRCEESMRAARCSRCFVVGISALAQLACPLPAEVAGDRGERAQAIVGGQLESGWPGVGALTFSIPGYGYQGSFCTATLIAPRWVLTAAHCLEEQEGMALDPSMTFFYVGPDANPASYAGPASGQLLRADTFVPHPDYDPQATLHDVGLVHLAQAATGVASYPLSSTAMTGSFIGQRPLYVGYGATDGVQQAGSGVKRSASIEIVDIDDASYLSAFGSSGICFGDSGGPGLLQIGGQWRVIGVNSTVAGSGGGDPCRAYYNHMRVDVYAPWIAEVTGAPPPSCVQNPDMCHCAGACKSDGSCDNSVCQVLSCEALYDCLIACDEDMGCQNDCYLRGTAAGQAALDAMFDCFDRQCAALEGEAFQQCATAQCQDAIQACMPIATGPQSCAFVNDCIDACAASDQGCPMACYEQGTAEAQRQLDAMYACMNDRCGNIVDASAYRDCLANQCAAEIEACLPPARCDPLGGDCPSGEACAVTLTRAFDCYPSAGLGRGSICAPSSTTLPCADGLVCQRGGFSSYCHALCRSGADCQAGEDCVAPVFEGIDAVGACQVRAAADAGSTADASAALDSGSTVDAGGPGSDAATSPPDAGSSAPDAASADTTAVAADASASLGYLAPCASDSQCASNLCRELANRGRVCLAPCDARLGHYDCPTTDSTGCQPVDVTALNLGGTCVPGAAAAARQGLGERCQAVDGYQTCVSGLCEGICLQPCSDGQCPAGYRCDTSEIEEPGVCRRDVDEPGCGCAAAASPADGDPVLLSVALLALRLRRRPRR
jgi:secreted trypsin-like serine protease